VAFRAPISWINISAWMIPNNRDWTRLAPRNPSLPSYFKKKSTVSEKEMFMVQMDSYKVAR